MTSFRSRTVLSISITHPELYQTIRQVVGNFVQRQIFARARRALHFEIVTVIMMKLLKRFDQQIVDRQPDRPAPVRIAAEYPSLRLARLITNDLCSPRKTSE